MFKKQNMTTWIFVVVILVFVAVGVMGAISNKKDDSGVKPIPDSTSKTFDMDEQPLIGKKDAPVEMVLFADYQCPHCKEWEDTVYPKVKAKYLDTGIASLRVVHFPVINIQSYYAAMASEIVYSENPSKWESFHHLLYKNQAVLTNDFLAEKMSKYTDYSKEEALSLLTKQTKVDDVLSDEKEGDKRGVTGTPSFFIGGKKMDSYEAADIEKAVNAAKKAASK